MPAETIETAPAEIQPPVAPPSADSPQSDVVPESVTRLMKNLFPADDVPAAEKPAPEPKEPKADAKPAKTDAPAPKADAKPAATPPAPEEPGVKLRQPKVVRPELPLVEPPKPAAPAREEGYKADPEWENTLEETEREMLADARFMEQRFPDKYKGMAAKTAAFIKQHAELTQKPEFDPESQEYKYWLERNQPRLTREQIREIEAERVSDRVRKEYDGKLADVQHKLFVREQEPKIEALGRTLFAELSQQSLPDEVMEAIKKDGYEKASAVYGLELETAQAMLTAATDDIVELERISTKDPETGRPLQPIIDDPSNPKFAQHQRLGQMIADVSENFKNTAPANQQLKNGKWFVTRDEWNAIKPDQRHRFWTFSNKEVIDISKRALKPAITQAIEQKRGYITKLGFTRAPAAKVEAPKPPPVKPEPPVPTNTPRIPAATPAPGDSDPITEIDARAAKLAAQLAR